MNRHDISLIFNTLRNESLFPRDVVNRTVITLAAIKSCREHQHVIVALETSLYHTREVTTVTSCFVDTDAHRFQTRKIEQEIIHQITEITIIMLSDDGTQSHSILTTQRVIRNKSIELAVILVR